MDPKARDALLLSVAHAVRALLSFQVNGVEAAADMRSALDNLDFALDGADDVDQDG